MTKNNNGTVSEIYTLPSLGKIYGEDFPQEVTIRSMTTFEEKMRLGNQGFWNTICNILDAVVTSPENFSAKEMSLFDFQFLMYKMRTVSYGPTYKVSITCPHCGKQSVVNIDLDAMKVNYLQEGITDSFEIGPLPRSKDTIQCRFMRVYDEIANERRAKEILKRSPEYVGDPTYILNIASKISAINGEAVTNLEAQLYVEKMNAMDSAYLRGAYDKIIGDVGMDTLCMETCPNCGEELEFELPFNSEFFRPTFDF